MELELAGRRALVTGSSIGIGYAIAQVLAAEGAHVAVHGRDRGRAETAADTIRNAGGVAVVVTGDLTVEGCADAIVEEAGRLLGGPVEMLVNNAGGRGERLDWQQTPVDAWTFAYDRNVLAAVRMANAALPAMRAAGWGRIVNISSLAGAAPAAAGPDYSACKAAINSLTKSLSKAVAADGITVNAISPSTVFSPRLEQIFRQMAADRGWAESDAPWETVERAVATKMFQVPVGRVGDPAEIGRTVAFLCSPLTAYITGIKLHVDGGAMPAL